MKSLIQMFAMFVGLALLPGCTGIKDNSPGDDSNLSDSTDPLSIRVGKVAVVRYQLETGTINANDVHDILHQAAYIFDQLLNKEQFKNVKGRADGTIQVKKGGRVSAFNANVFHGGEPGQHNFAILQAFNDEFHQVDWDFESPGDSCFFAVSFEIR